jgi:hypothetical protein
MCFPSTFSGGTGVPLLSSCQCPASWKLAQDPSGFPQKAFKTNFSHFLKQEKNFKNFLSQEQNRSGEIYSFKPLLPPGKLVLFLFLFLLFPFVSFLFSFVFFYFYTRRWRKTSYSY